MFLLYFLVFTLIFTIFENIFLASIFFVCITIGLYIHQCIAKKKIVFKKTIYALLGGFALAGMVFGIKEYRYYGTIFMSQNKSLAYQSLIGTGIISDITNQGKYVFAYDDADYLLYSKKEYSIGDHIRLVGNLQKNTRTDGFSYRKISSGTFAVPLFSGSFDFNKWMKMKGRKGTIYETNSIQIDGAEGLDGIGRIDNSNPSIGVIQQMKRGIQEKVIESYGKNKISGLVLGMLIGDKSQIPESEYQSFINSGLVHLIAVSGGNILMIVVFLQCILFFLPFYVRMGIILITIIGYSLICGLDSSVFRAVLMGGMNMVALFWGREVNIRRLLSISCIIMLVINPYFLAYDTGFLLSYSALLGIVYFQDNDKGEMINDKLEVKKTENHLKRGLQYVYKNYISPSIGASIGIFPVIIFFMGKINILGIIGNLFVLPIVPFVMIYGFVSVWVYSWLKWARLLWIEQILVQYIYRISELLSVYGLYFSVTGLRFKYVILLMCLIVFIVWRTKKMRTLKIET